jgi:hypothetical protein
MVDEELMKYSRELEEDLDGAILPTSQRRGMNGPVL